MDLFDMHKRRVARVAISASAARKQGAAGVVQAARQYLATLDCRRLARGSEAEYLEVLEEVTHELMAVLPSGTRSWGLARKLLNIFARDVLYHAYLAEPSGIKEAEPFMEVPLDSVSAARIKEEFKGQLPVWPGVKRLTPELSHALQLKAREIASRHGLHAVHMDTIWWGAREF